MPPSTPIDRRTVVRRHNPRVTAADPFAALSVGNGRFAFTADVTGLQTFLDFQHDQFPLCTASHWAWHTIPAPDHVASEPIRYKMYDAHGRKVGYATDQKGQEELFNWLRENPHRLHLGRVGMELTSADGTIAKIEDIQKIEQTLDLWTGTLDSRFRFADQPVRVQTAAHPTLDLLAVRVESPLLAGGRLRIVIAFPYGSPNVDMANWDSPGRHITELHQSDGKATFDRSVDQTEYHAKLAYWHAKLKQRAAHVFTLESVNGQPVASLEFCIAFSPDPIKDELPDVDSALSASARGWEQFWTTGGAIDLGNCTSKQAPELERRIVLSQYNTALHCSGDLPSAETGLLFNSWYGKFHLEMHWWHSVHFTAWNRFDRFANSMGFYHEIEGVARMTAQRQGYGGVRWPKMVGPGGLDSPSPIGPLLIWQQPHPIYYAELFYQQDPSAKTLAAWGDIVEQTAAFMLDYAVPDATGRRVLGPPLKTVSENTETTTTTNPTFELSYWRWGIATAQTWRQRRGLAPDPRYADLLAHLAPLPVADGKYLFQEGTTDTYTKWNYEHPAIVGAMGVLPGLGVDLATMHATVKQVMAVWQWDRCWGWDFPMMAMACARVGEPQFAVDALLIDSPKNRYMPNGHVYQRPSLTAYLPGNGGFLGATALMAAGWTGNTSGDAPGFPKDGKWSVRHEGLRPFLAST